MSDNILYIKIPMNRVGVLIGTYGKVKTTIEKKFQVNLKIDGTTGNVWISPNQTTFDPIAFLKSRDIVMAISRGFSPLKAYRLFNLDANLRIIDLRDIFGKGESDISRVKSRIIGKKGKTRRLLEEYTGVDVSVYGYTLSIIGNQNQIDIAKDAIERLIRGNQHKSVYNFLQRKRHKLKLGEMELWRDSNSVKPNNG